MTNPLWIYVPKWDTFQHYKDRDAPWIKTYTRLLHDQDWLDLSSHQRGVLLGVWLAYCSSNRRLTADHVKLSRHLNVRVTLKDLEALNHAGFIEVLASTALAERLQADSTALASRAPAHSQEGETEGERYKTPPPTTPVASYAGDPAEPGETYDERVWNQALANGAGWSRDYKQPSKLEPDLLLPTRGEGEGI